MCVQLEQACLHGRILVSELFAMAMRPDGELLAVCNLLDFSDESRQMTGPTNVIDPSRPCCSVEGYAKVSFGFRPADPRWRFDTILEEAIEKGSDVLNPGDGPFGEPLAAASPPQSPGSRGPPCVEAQRRCEHVPEVC